MALHPRAHAPGRHTTDPKHLAKAHRQQRDWTPTRFLAWAATIGPHTQAVIEHQLTARKHPEHGFRTCLGLLSLGKKYGKERLEAACARAVKTGALHYRHIAAMLANGLDKIPVETPPEPLALPLAHENVRGAQYYQ